MYQLNLPATRQWPGHLDSCQAGSRVVFLISCSSSHGADAYPASFLLHLILCICSGQELRASESTEKGGSHGMQNYQCCDPQRRQSASLVVRFALAGRSLSRHACVERSEYNRASLHTLSSASIDVSLHTPVLLPLSSLPSLPRFHRELAEARRHSAGIAHGHV